MKKNKEQRRNRRRMHIRKTVSGTADKPRIHLYKSNKFLITGVSDDATGTVIGGYTADRSVKGAQELAKKVAALLKKKKIKDAVFDRSGYKYHGVVMKYADSLRENGVNI